MASKNKTHEITVKGIITPVEWDEEENVTAVLLEGDDEEPYYIENNAQGERLIDMVDAYVKVTGVARELGGETMLTVRTFSVEEAEDDSDFDESEEDEEWGDQGWEDEVEEGGR